MGFLKKLFGTKQDRPPQSMTPELATQIIQEYGAVLQNNSPLPGGVADISNLPYPKNQIKKALIIGLKTNDDPQMQEMLKTAYIQLTDWQEGVGDSAVVAIVASHSRVISPDGIESPSHHHLLIPSSLSKRGPHKPARCVPTPPSGDYHRQKSYSKPHLF